MRNILFILLAAILILGLFATGCEIDWSDIKELSGIGWVVEPAGIHDINIWTDESLPPQYFLNFVSSERNTCVRFDHYIVTRDGNTIRVEVFNLRITRVMCGQRFSYTEHTIPLGSRFITGETYTVEVNSVTETFVAQ